VCSTENCQDGDHDRLDTAAAQEVSSLGRERHHAPLLDDEVAGSRLDTIGSAPPRARQRFESHAAEERALSLAPAPADDVWTWITSDPPAHRIGEARHISTTFALHGRRPEWQGDSLIRRCRS